MGLSVHPSGFAVCHLLATLLSPLTSTERSQSTSSICFCFPGFGPNQLSSPSGKGICSNGNSWGSTEDVPSLFRPKDLAGTLREKILLDYSTYMSRLVQPETGTSPLQSPCHSAMGSPTPQQVSGANGVVWQEIQMLRETDT